MLQDRLYEPHIAPFTELVDELRTQDRGSVPYIAPTFGGINAKGLVLFRDPGPFTEVSGMLCHQNDDATAARLTRLLHQVGIEPAMINLWNSYPWYINRHPKIAEIRLALPSLARVLELMRPTERRLHVYLGGAAAHNAWKEFEQEYPVMAKEVDTYAGRHTSNLGATVKGMTRVDVEKNVMLPIFKTFSTGLLGDEAPIFKPTGLAV